MLTHAQSALVPRGRGGLFVSRVDRPGQRSAKAVSELGRVCADRINRPTAHVCAGCGTAARSVPGVQ